MRTSPANPWLAVVVVVAAALAASCAPAVERPPATAEEAVAGREAAPPAAAAAPAATSDAEAAEAADVPYSLQLAPFAVEGYPGLHSFALAGEPSRLVLLAGRRNGLHGFAPSREAAEFPSFPRDQANDTVYVLDLPGRRLLGSAAVGALPAPYAEQLQSSNVQSLEEDGWLYVLGGYGPSPDPPHGLITLPWITAIDLEALTATVTGGGALDAAFAAAHMASVQHPALAVTGGEARALDGRLLLLFGHRFDGEYTPGGGAAYQEYSNSVRVFTAAASRQGGAVQLDLAFLGTVPSNTQRPPDNPYHRRDLSVRSALDPSGAPRIAAYGGVFKGGRMEGYLKPLYVTAAGAAAPGCVGGLGIAICEDTAAQQLLSQYDCAALPVYSAARQAMYTTFFGGISGFYWDPACRCLQRDAVDIQNGVDGLPFIDSVSTLRVTAAGTAQFLDLGQTFPPAGGEPECVGTGGEVVPAGFLGAETHFVAAPGAPVEDDVLQLDAIDGPTVVGYLVGGIAAACPGDVPNCYASTRGGSCASSLIYEVTLDPATPAPTVRLLAPGSG